MRRLLYVCGALALGWGLAMGLRVAGSRRVGEGCETDRQCAGAMWGDAACVQDHGARYCTRGCDTEDDCPARWRCESLTINLNGVASPVSSRSCVRPVGG